MNWLFASKVLRASTVSAAVAEPISEVRETNPNTEAVSYRYKNSTKGTPLVFIAESDFASRSLSNSFYDLDAAAEDSVGLPSREDLLSSFQTTYKPRRLDVCAVGAGALSGVEFTLIVENLVRHLVLIDPVFPDSRTNISWWIKILDRLIPFRLILEADKGLDFESRMHRVRCPVLVIFSASISHKVRKRSQKILGRLPNAWIRQIHVPLGSPCVRLGDECKLLMKEFFLAPFRMPQKRLKSAD